MIRTRQASKLAEAKALAENREKNLPDDENSKPKTRKLNGYMIWSLQERKTISKYEGLSGRDIVKILGSRWQNLPEEEKLKWNTIAKEGSNPIEEKIEKKEKKPVSKSKDENVKNKKGKHKKI